MPWWTPLLIFAAVTVLLIVGIPAIVFGLLAWERRKAEDETWDDD